MNNRLPYNYEQIICILKCIFSTAEQSSNISGTINFGQPYIQKLSAFLTSLSPQERVAGGELVLRAEAHVLFAFGDFKNLYIILECHTFQHQHHAELQKFWYEAHYKESEISRGRALGAVDKYRIRKKYPLPSGIWDGEETIYCFKERSRNALKKCYQSDPYPSPDVKRNLSKVTGLTLTQEKLTGIISIDGRQEVRHECINLHVEGSVSIQSDPKHAKFLSALDGPSKSLLLIGYCVEISKGGVLPAGRTDIPFELPLKPPGNQILYQTYHGVFITIQYNLRCEMKRPLLSKDIQGIYEFIVEYERYPTGAPVFKPRPLEFLITPETVTQQGHKREIPNFRISGRLGSSICLIDEPFTGEFVVEFCEATIRSVELQLVRVETHKNNPGSARPDGNKEATEVQNIQICEGDIERGTTIPIYMIFPRLFTCPTVFTNNFNIEFEVNLVIILNDNHLITENFPLRLIRSTKQPIDT
ncbi:Vacuolar protein sorting-associated protein 26C [Fragariocoptes setiger]|uniref:Vacuolar protein sorting-associated protein 26C n=1 Tax=Fragariocoptes setiger TaxID=1670756 RepID=A0ABQ7SA83_9ACAR|nr:Vacuolar protein sorting-associated protein 26C [Fragariocoptes setiger]